MQIQPTNEKVQPELTDGEGFEHTVGRGGITLKAASNGHGALQIKAYLHGNKVAEAYFEMTPDNQNIASEDTQVDERYRRTGIATVMYQYAKELGNSIAPSPNRTDDGNAMWKGFMQKKSLDEGTEEVKPLTKAVISFYKPVIDKIEPGPVDNYVNQARELLDKAPSPTIRSKMLEIFKKGQKDPMIQGGVVTAIAAILTGGLLTSASRMGLSPAQTNIMLQAVLNTVIPTIIARINNKSWVDTIKYTLASAVIGTGVAALSEKRVTEDLSDTMYFFDVGDRNPNEITVDDSGSWTLKSIGLRSTMSGKWYYRPGRDSTDYSLANKLEFLEKKLGAPPRPWKPPVREEQKKSCAYSNCNHTAILPESLSGEQMLTTLRKNKHHSSELNQTMDQYILDHAWGVKMVSPSSLLDPEMVDNDPFDRVIEIDPDQVDYHLNQIKRKQKIDPIILGPNGAVIDGNHRVAAAKALKQDLLAYVPMDSEVDEGWKDIAAAGALATGLAFGGGNADAAKTPAPKPAVTQQHTQNVTSTSGEELLRKTAEAAGLRGNELTAFLAQCAHETLNFTRLKEFGGKLDFRKYDPKYAPSKAKQLGNTQIGDGARYKGRGFIHLTGRYNYKKAGEALGLPLEKNPELVENPRVAAKVAVWFWQSRVKNRMAGSDYSDVKSVTKTINPGLKHLDRRQEKFDTFKVASR